MCTILLQASDHVAIILISDSRSIYIWAKYIQIDLDVSCVILTTSANIHRRLVGAMRIDSVRGVVCRPIWYFWLSIKQLMTQRNSALLSFFIFFIKKVDSYDIRCLHWLVIVKSKNSYNTFYQGVFVVHPWCWKASTSAVSAFHHLSTISFFAGAGKWALYRLLICQNNRLKSWKPFAIFCLRDPWCVGP